MGILERLLAYTDAEMTELESGASEWAAAMERTEFPDQYHAACVDAAALAARFRGRVEILVATADETIAAGRFGRACRARCVRVCEHARADGNPRPMLVDLPQRRLSCVDCSSGDRPATSGLPCSFCDAMTPAQKLIVLVGPFITIGDFCSPCATDLRSTFVRLP